MWGRRGGSKSASPAAMSRGKETPAARAGPLRSWTSGRKLGVTPAGEKSLVRNTSSQDLCWKWTLAFTCTSVLGGFKNFR